MAPKLIVRIKNFRTYTLNPDREDGFYEFIFEQGVNLLKGASGSGKSTIFSAISWCLFKKPSMGNAPLYGGTKETIVSLNVENRYLITRTSPKTLFTVTILDRGDTLENEEAQIFVCQQWGKEHVWKTCNYVSQGSINNLINGELTDTQRWEVLYTLAFETGMERENVSLEELKSELRIRVDETTRKYEAIQLELSRRESSIQKSRTEMEELRLTMGDHHPIFQWKDGRIRSMMDQSRRLEPGEVTEEQMRECEGSLENHRLRILNLETQLETLRESKAKLSEEKTARETQDRETLKVLTREISQRKLSLEDQRKLVERGLKLRGILNKIREDYPEVNRWPEEEIPSRLGRFLPKLQWLRTRDWREIVHPQAETLIQEEIYQVELATRRQQLEAEKSRLETDIVKTLPRLRETPGTWLPTLDYEDSDPGTGTKVMMDCPCCSRKLVMRFRQGASQPEGVREYHGELSLTKKMIQNITQRDQLQQQLTELPLPTKLPSRSLSILSGLKADIQTWMGIPEGLRDLLVQSISRPPVSNQMIAELQALETIKLSELSNLEARQRVLEGELSSMMESRDQVSLSLSLIDSEFSSRIQVLTDEMMTLLGELNNLSRETPVWERRLGKLRDDLEWWRLVRGCGLESRVQFEEMVRKRETYRKVMEQIQGVETRLRELVSQQESATGESQTVASQLRLFSELQADLEGVENKVLSDCVDRVSHLTNNFLDNAFDNPILVNLVTEKETKGGKGRKHSVGISIKAGKPGLPNLVERSLDGFSGGETDRISLGFSSAITTYSPFPVLMLDECISSLDTEMKDKVIRALRQQAKMTNKAVVLICHDAVDGLFDHVAEVGV
jgi:DNA repair exonuclease SbcCD ATPase subunit